MTIRYFTPLNCTIDDAYMAQSTSTTNYGSGTTLSVGNQSPNITRGLIKFDLSEIPSNAVITSSRLILSSTSAVIESTWSINRVLKNWVEAEVTWSRASTSEAWDTVGAAGASDIAQTSDDTCVMQAGNGGTVVFSSSSTVTSVQNWVNGTWSNYGWRLSTNDTASANTVVSSEQTSFTTGTSPLLVVEYDTPEVELVSISYSLNGSAASTLNLLMPESAPSGSVLICLISRTNTQTPTSVPEGWQLLCSGTPTGYGRFIYYKVAGSSEPTSYTWVYATTTKTLAQIYVFSGVDPNTPISTYSNTAYTTSNTSLVAASVTVPSNGSMGLFLGSVYSVSGTSITLPSGWEKISAIGGLNPDFWAIVGAEPLNSGSTGSITATISAASTTKHAFLLVLNPKSKTTTHTLDSKVKSVYTSINTIDSIVEAVSHTTHTVDLVILSDSVETGHSIDAVVKVSTRYFYKGFSAFIPSAPGNFTEFTTQQYSDADSDNNVYVLQSAVTTDTEYFPFQEFTFVRGQEEEIRFTWRGKAAPEASIRIYVYNYTDAAWELILTETVGDTEELITASVDAAYLSSKGNPIGDYYDEDTKITFLVTTYDGA